MTGDEDKARRSALVAAIGAARNVLCLACPDMVMLAVRQTEADDAARAAVAESRRVFWMDPDPAEALALRRQLAGSGIARAPVFLAPPQPHRPDAAFARLWEAESVAHPDLVLCGPRTPPDWLAEVLGRARLPVGILCEGLDAALRAFPGGWPLVPKGRTGGLTAYRLVPDEIGAALRARLGDAWTTGPEMPDRRSEGQTMTTGPDDARPEAELSHLRALVAEQAEMLAALQMQLQDNETKAASAREALADREALLDQLRRADIRHLADLSKIEKLTAEVAVLQAALRAAVASRDIG